MTKQYKVFVKDGKGRDGVSAVTQGVGRTGQPLHLTARAGATFALQDDAYGRGVAPDQVRVQRVGKNLTLMFDTSTSPDVVIDDYYGNGQEAQAKLVGMAENGQTYEYQPHDPTSRPTLHLLDGSASGLMSLGGVALAVSSASASLLPVAAFGGWVWAAGAAAVAAVASHSGAASAAPDLTPPLKGTGTLAHTNANDTGVLNTDSITSNTKPSLVIKAESGASVAVLLNNKTYQGVERQDEKGTYDVQVTAALSDGNYNPVIFVTDAAGNTSEAGACTAFTIDTSASNNPANGTGQDVNVGSSTSVTLKAISDDTGTSSGDFVTQDNTLLVLGEVAQFSATGSATGDQVRVQVVNAKGEVVAQAYVQPTASHTWATTSPTNALPDGDYTLTAAIVDAAGNVVKPAAADQKVTVSSTYLVAVADTAIAQETGIDANKAPLVGISPTGQVLRNDVDVYASGLVVTNIQYGKEPVLSVAAGSTSTNQGVRVAGQYGALTLGADGSYTYSVDEDKAKSLTAADHPTDSFTYTARNSAGTESAAVLTVTVNGANDLAVITPQSSPADVQAALRATDTTTTKSGTVVVKDDDAGQSVFQQPTSDMRKGAYGNFTFEEPEGSSNGKWTYALDGSNTALHALGAGDVVTDLLTLRSNDGTATQNITITITGANDAPVLVQNTTLALATFDQNLAAPTGVMGIKVSGLIAGITDADSGAQKGIAITDVDSTHGTLWATFNGGTDWMAVTGVDAAHALLMRNDDNTQVYYQEKANPDASVHDASALTSAFTFVAWDQTTGKAATQVDANARGAENAFSVDAQQVQVNDTFQLDALTDTFLGGTGFDTLVLNQPLGTLDLTAVKFTGIEKIATTAHGANAIILNAASVGQADAMGGVHQLFIEGDANDGVTFTGHAEAIAADTTRVSGYDRYALDATHALLLQHGMTMVFTA